MKANIKYSELLKQVLGLVIIPLLYCGLFLSLIFSLDSFQFSETVVNIVIFGGSFLLIGISVITVKKFIVVDAAVEYNMRGIHFHLNRKTFIFPHDDIFINYQNIANASLDEDESGRSVGTLKIKSPKKSIIIMADKFENTAQFIEFWYGLEQRFSSFNASNENHPTLLIQQKGFYESSFMKFFAYLALVFSISLIILKIVYPNTVSTWKLVGFYCYAIPFILTVFNSNKKSNYSEK